MSVAQSLAAFLAAATVLTVTPGLDTAIVLRTAATAGARPAWFAGLGISLGCLAWGAIVAVGLGALLAASPIAFTALKWIGAAYLLWVGMRLIVSPRREFAGSGGSAGASEREAFNRGFLTNMLNPKVGVFYVTFLPQFIPAGTNVAGLSLALAAIHVGLGLVWFAMLIAATVPASRLLRQPRVVASLDRLTGGVFVLFGVKLALSRAA
jgi:threonine/homoserine/homoserine lactone efflux protein